MKIPPLAPPTADAIRAIGRVYASDPSDVVLAALSTVGYPAVIRLATGRWFAQCIIDTTDVGVAVTVRSATMWETPQEAVHDCSMRVCELLDGVDE